MDVRLEGLSQLLPSILTVCGRTGSCNSPWVLRLAPTHPGPRRGSWDIPLLQTPLNPGEAARS